MKKAISIVWFRQDLRLCDNPAIEEAARLGKVLPIYIFDDCAPPPFKIGSASKVWLHYSLDQLNHSLGGNLNIYKGESSTIIAMLLKKKTPSHLFWNVSYEPWHLKQEQSVKILCKNQSISYEAFNGNYLWEPDEIVKSDESYYKVFTAYKKRCLLCEPRAAIKTKKIETISDPNRLDLSALQLLPSDQKWHSPLIKPWKIGESAAKDKLSTFLKKNLAGYKTARDYPSTNQTSLLSPHLHFGEISPAQIWEAIQSCKKRNNGDEEHFLSELLWREFSSYLLFHFPIHKENFNPKFNPFPWKTNKQYLKAWQTGKTGYPLIDAGMRELWQTGYMHNRVRMVTASFLVKNLNIHWHKGRDWFWDCLLDADLANNSASWQWVAGCGVDAAPYFRIFNPTTQGEKFDKTGEYTKKFLPELKKLPDKYLFKPWTAPKELLQSANIILGKTYPYPIIDLKTSRNQALTEYKKL